MSLSFRTILISSRTKSHLQCTTFPFIKHETVNKTPLYLDREEENDKMNINKVYSKVMQWNVNKHYIYFPLEI